MSVLEEVLKANAEYVENFGEKGKFGSRFQIETEQY